jgi:hypothetical protein
LRLRGAQGQRQQQQSDTQAFDPKRHFGGPMLRPG